jgi:hypothetical protein
MKIGGGPLDPNFQLYQRGERQVKPLDGWIEKHTDLQIAKVNLDY